MGIYLDVVTIPCYTLRMQLKGKKVAIVHDFLLKLGGAERLVQALSEMFPDAPIYTLLYDEKKVGHIFPKERVRTSGLQKLPKFLRNRYRYFFSRMPKEVELWDFSAFDLVISSSGAYSHGIVTPVKTKHVSYCHSPMRYAWDYAHEYLNEQKLHGLKRFIVANLMKRVRMWDIAAADRVDFYIANSEHVRKRIRKYYRMDSTVVYPPVDVDRFRPQKKHDDYFLIVSTLTPYKKIEMAISLFNKLGKRLVIVGDGPARSYLELIKGPSVELTGFLSDDEVKKYMQNCRALIFPSEEDFGITPVEAMAAGKPVLAYGRGGILETVIPGKTGELFAEQTIESMEDGLGRLILNENQYKIADIREHAEQFSREKFEKNFLKQLTRIL